MESKIIRFFNYSTGALLLAVAAALFISSRVGANLILPHDPIFQISIRHLFWIVGGVCLVMAVVALWGEPTFMRAMVIAWLVTNLAVYRLGCLWYGAHSLSGYLGSFAAAFGVSAAAAGTLAEATLGWLVLGSYFILIGLWWLQRQNRNSLKMSCSTCGGHIKFSIQNLGQQISCPHCQAALTLRKADNLKMSCFFCNEHIEFPAHALGEKLKCPHCKMDITLREPA
jgi:hypothetical protein